MADLAAQLALPHDLGCWQASGFAATSAPEKASGAETATGTEATRAARFRALLGPPAEPDSDAEQPGSCKGKARTPPASGATPSPGATSWAPAATLAAPAGLARDFTPGTGASGESQSSPDSSKSGSATENASRQPRRELGAQSVWGAFAAATPQPDPAAASSPNPAGQPDGSASAPSAAAPADAAELAACVQPALPAIAGAFGLAPGDADPARASWSQPSPSAAESVRNSTVQPEASGDEPPGDSSSASLSRSSRPLAGAERRTTGSALPRQSRMQPLETSPAALFPAALPAAATNTPPATAAPRRLEELKAPAAESALATAGRVASATEDSHPPSSSSGGDGGTGSPAAQGELAFAGRLIQATAAGTPSQASAPAPAQGRGQNAAGSNGGNSVRPAGPAQAAAGADSLTRTAAEDRAEDSQGGTRAAASAARSGGETESEPAERPHEPAPTAKLSQTLESPGGAAAPAANSSPPQDAPRAAVPGGAPAAQPAAAVAAPSPAAAPHGPARDITLSLDNGPQRVAVRLVERDGEVHVAVRTPDTALAGDLRRALPSLTAKLEQSGFRTETWHSESAPRRPAETPAGGTSQDPAGWSRQGGRERREGQPQPRENEPRPDQNKERKDFAWFMSSLG